MKTSSGRMEIRLEGRQLPPDVGNFRGDRDFKFYITTAGTSIDLHIVLGGNSFPACRRRICGSVCTVLHLSHKTKCALGYCLIVCCGYFLIDASYCVLLEVSLLCWAFTHLINLADHVVHGDA
jgi:hypothetical protein